MAPFESSKNCRDTFNKKYKKHFTRCVTAFVGHLQNDLCLENSHIERIKFLVDYNCKGGKNNRAYCLTNMTETLCRLKKIDFDDKIESKAFSLACCVEILQASFLVADDISDNSDLRRGKPCWYKREEIKLAAVNDSFLLESFVFFILRKFFDGEAESVDLTELFRDVIFKTQIGQMIDLSNQKLNQSIEEMENAFTMKNYVKIITFKTAYYTYFIPIASAMIVCGLNSKEQLSAALQVAVELGRKFQIEDDYIDCFCGADKSGKVGKDIEENKCSWLVVTALEKSNKEQKQLLLKHYGRDSREDRDAVKALYEDLGLQEYYKQQENESYRRIARFIEENDSVIPKEALMPMLEQIHFRPF